MKFSKTESWNDLCVYFMRHITVTGFSHPTGSAASAGAAVSTVSGSGVEGLDGGSVGLGVPSGELILILAVFSIMNTM